jgi:hypothetical protein
MNDRDEVIRELQAEIDNAVYPDRPRRFMIPLWLAEKALAALKEQAPRLMTYDELSAISRTDSIVYVERRTKTYYNEMAFVAVEKVYGDTVTFRGQKSIFGHNKKDYGKEWRCWTSRPTDAQRKAVEWDD